MRLAGEKLTLYCDILAGLWAPRADPQLNPALWKPTWPKDWPRYGQEGKHVEAKKWQKEVGIRILRLKDEKLILNCIQRLP